MRRFPHPAKHQVPPGLGEAYGRRCPVSLAYNTTTVTLWGTMMSVPGRALNLYHRTSWGVPSDNASGNTLRKRVHSTLDSYLAFSFVARALIALLLLALPD